ncbi:hypothetical protein V495_05143 [Pseudogymnoascus sp. VKM F-4514 (FW-929)]|nr:hypothetical protein V495_05143 [Pseudogymnoascus sp. VKM F-4514 (FW-929)]KFY54497.1 hypothetical protein V497_07664 [Pseudogymnoascus sp. VKM F-4516 (FW-969)]
MDESPYITTGADIFISPYTPFLHHISILEEDEPFQRWCEQRLIYYTKCTHSTEFRRCNNRENPNREDNNCNQDCRLPEEYVACFNVLCPDCETLGRPEPAVSDDEIKRLYQEYDSRFNATFDNFYLYVCNAEQEGNMELNRMEDVLYNQRSVDEEILAELAAAAIEDAHDVMELDGGSSEDEEGSSEVGYSGPGSSPGPGSSGSERFYEFEPEPEREDYSEGWVERLPRGDTALTRADWFRRLAWRTARQREMRQPPAPYYIPDKADDETDLLVRLQEPGTGEDQCVVCMDQLSEGDDIRILPCGHLFHYECIRRWLFNRRCPVCRQRYEIKGLPRFSDEDGEGDSNDGSEPATSSPPPPPSSGTGQQGGGEEERGQAQGNAPVAHMWPIGTFKSMARLSYPYSTFGGQSLSRWQPTARNMVMA